MDSFDQPTKETIRDHRLAYGLTRKQAANLVHCTADAWKHWELGARKMHPAMWELFKIKLSQHGG